MTASSPATRNRGPEIFLVSLAALLLEISFTRVVSFKLFYYYTYLAIGLALLGIGSGGVLVAVSDRLRRASTGSVLTWGSIAGAAATVLSGAIVARTSITTTDLWSYTGASLGALARLVLIAAALALPFLAVGVMVSVILGRDAGRVGRLYFADLIGAGAACAVVVWLLEHRGPPATIALAGAVLAATGLVSALRSPGGGRRGAIAAVAVAVPLVAVTAVPSLAPPIRVDAVKTQVDEGETAFSGWSPIFRVDAARLDDRLLLFHDALLGSAIYEYDGDPESLDRYEEDPRAFPFAATSSDEPSVLIIGAAGGNEVLASLYFDASRIVAVELNPLTRELVTDTFADYAGRIAEHPDVEYLQGDGRTYIERSDERFDLLWYPAPDSYAAQNAATAGAFVLSESYLYTEEMISEAFDHLTDEGMVVAQFGEVDFDAKPNRTTRYVSTARRALEGIGVEDPTDHFVVLTTPTDLGASRVASILVKPSPFTDAEVDGATRRLGVVPGARLEYAPGRDGRAGLVARMVTTPSEELDGFYEDLAYDLTPIEDDSPFFWSFARLGDVLTELTQPLDTEDLEDSAGERVILLLFAISVVFATVFLLLPFLKVRRIWSELPAKGRSGLYFACLGLGFILWEITLIQRLVLFLGYPTYSLTVTLASLLVFTGLGSLASERIRGRGDRVVLALGAAIAALAALSLFALPVMVDALLGSPLAVRVVATFLALAPLGLCLGTFMPQGLRAVARLSPHEHEYVAWGWAVNGFASVAGSVLATILAMAFGFSVVLVVAATVYGVGLVALRGLLATEPVPAA